MKKNLTFETFHPNVYTRNTNTLPNLPTNTSLAITP